MQEPQVCYEVSERRACQVLGFPRASHSYQNVLDERAELRMRLRELVTIRVRYGYRRLHILSQREGWRVNHKLVYRLHCEEGLQMWIDVEIRLNSESVLERLSDLFVSRGVPDHIRSDNGPEFTEERVRDWLRRVEVKTFFIEPGSPWEN